MIITKIVNSADAAVTLPVAVVCLEEEEGKKRRRKRKKREKI